MFVHRGPENHCAEHAICGVERCRVVADTFRNWRLGRVEEVMLAVSGLHNLRCLPAPENTDSRSPANQHSNYRP